MLAAEAACQAFSSAPLNFEPFACARLCLILNHYILSDAWRLHLSDLLMAMVIL
jgi:hypothetical protein